MDVSSLEVFLARLEGAWSNLLMGVPARGMGLELDNF